MTRLWPALSIIPEKGSAGTYFVTLYCIAFNMQLLRDLAGHLTQFAKDLALTGRFGEPAAKVRFRHCKHPKKPGGKITKHRIRARLDPRPFSVVALAVGRLPLGFRIRSCHYLRLALLRLPQFHDFLVDACRAK